ncbi:MAG: ABC transporter permease, partial [Syntrophomonadaceae bacterium]|nr:ABC transporter permease [Syntrophomonadaceae bacterium]
MGSTTRHSLATVSSVLVLILIWKLLSLMIGAEIILPAPESTVRDLLSVVRSPDFWPSVGATVARGLIGFLVSCLGGIAVGLLAGFNSLAFWMLQPLLTVIRSTPVMAVILLALIWFQTEMVPIFVSFLMAFPIMCSNTIEGIDVADALDG